MPNRCTSLRSLSTRNVGPGEILFDATMAIDDALTARDFEQTFFSRGSLIYSRDGRLIEITMREIPVDLPRLAAFDGAHAAVAIEPDMPPWGD